MDLSNQELRKLPKNDSSFTIKVLDISKNCLQKLDNVECFTELTEVSKPLIHKFILDKVLFMYLVNCKSKSDDENVYSSKINKNSKIRFIQ